MKDGFNSWGRKRYRRSEPSWLASPPRPPRRLERAEANETPEHLSNDIKILFGDVQELATATGKLGQYTVDLSPSEQYSSMSMVEVWLPLNPWKDQPMAGEKTVELLSPTIQSMSSPASEEEESYHQMDDIASMSTSITIDKSFEVAHEIEPDAPELPAESIDRPATGESPLNTYINSAKEQYQDAVSKSVTTNEIEEGEIEAGGFGAMSIGLSMPAIDGDYNELETIEAFKDTSLQLSMPIINEIFAVTHEIEDDAPELPAESLDPPTTGESPWNAYINSAKEQYQDAVSVSVTTPSAEDAGSIEMSLSMNLGSKESIESIDGEFVFEMPSGNYDELDFEMSVAASERPSGSSVIVSNSPTYSPRFGWGAKAPSSKPEPTDSLSPTEDEAPEAATSPEQPPDMLSEESPWAAYINSAKEQYQDAVSSSATTPAEEAGSIEKMSLSMNFASKESIESIDGEFEFEMSSGNYDEVDFEMSVAASISLNVAFSIPENSELEWPNAVLTSGSSLPESLSFPSMIDEYRVDSPSEPGLAGVISMSLPSSVVRDVEDDFLDDTVGSIAFAPKAHDTLDYLGQEGENALQMEMSAPLEWSRDVSSLPLPSDVNNESIEFDEVVMSGEHPLISELSLSLSSGVDIESIDVEELEMSVPSGLFDLIDLSMSLDFGIPPATKTEETKDSSWPETSLEMSLSMASSDGVTAESLSVQYNAQVETDDAVMSALDTFIDEQIEFTISMPTVDEEVLANIKSEIYELSMPEIDEGGDPFAEIETESIDHSESPWNAYINSAKEQYQDAVSVSVTTPSAEDAGSIEMSLSMNLGSKESIESIDGEFVFEMPSGNYDELDFEMSVAASERPSGSSVIVSNSPTYSPRFGWGAKAPSSKPEPTDSLSPTEDEAPEAATSPEQPPDMLSEESPWAAYINSAKEQYQDAVSSSATTPAEEAGSIEKMSLSMNLEFGSEMSVNYDELEMPFSYEAGVSTKPSTTRLSKSQKAGMEAVQPADGSTTAALSSEGGTKKVDAPKSDTVSVSATTPAEEATSSTTASHSELIIADEIAVDESLSFDYSGPGDMFLTSSLTPSAITDRSKGEQEEDDESWLEGLQEKMNLLQQNSSSKRVNRASSILAASLVGALLLLR